VIVIPAIDLRDGACVQFAGGPYSDVCVRTDNPFDVACRWVQDGFRRLHLTDLDAATGRGSNADAVRDLLANAPAALQVGGGVRTSEGVQRIIGEGARWVVLSPGVLEEPRWLSDTARAFPRQLIVAADVADRRIVSHGSPRTVTRDILDVVDELNDLPLAGLLVTAVRRRGSLAGTDLFLMEDVAELSVHPVLAAGGIAAMHELRDLADRQVAGVVVGLALYTGALVPRVVAEEFAE